MLFFKIGMFQEPYIAKIQYLYSGCQVFRHFLSIAKTIFLIAFTILKIAFAIRQECRTRHFKLKLKWENSVDVHRKNVRMFRSVHRGIIVSLCQVNESLKTEKR